MPTNGNAGAAWALYSARAGIHAVIVMPEAILYPTGGGVGIIGIYKAFLEMQELGWIQGKLPRLIAVQAEGCAPIVKAFDEGKKESEFFENSDTVAFGINVPKALGDFLVLKALYETEGAQAEDGVWIVNSTLDFGRYPDIAVKAGIPVKWTIDVPKGYVNGCDHCDRLRFVIPLKKKCDAAIIQIKNGKGREMWKIQ